MDSCGGGFWPQESFDRTIVFLILGLAAVVMTISAGIIHADYLKSKHPRPEKVCLACHVTHEKWCDKK